jgi:3-deoxy-D-manno-octulosonic-acid transferase
MLRLLYNSLIYVAAPIAFGATLWRGLRDPAYRERRTERFGVGQPLASDDTLWVHAVSVGEVQAAVALIRELLRRYPQRQIIVTTGTPTGAQRVQSLFGNRVHHIFLPYDLPGAVRRFLNRVRPRVAIVMETEVWPNLFRECARRRIPVVIASARLSPKSVRGYRWLASLFKDALANGIEIAAQTQADADRFISVGANPEHTHVVGSVKFDLEVPEEVQAHGRAFRQTNFADRPVWIAGSTHPIEEDVLFAAHAKLRESHPRALLVLVPRHPNRFSEVKDWLTKNSVRFTTRSSHDAPNEGTVVFLVDTLGELLMFYASADVAFVGGSLVPIGGHNLLEPAAVGVPVITGPHNFNAPDTARALIERNAAREVRTDAELATTLAELIDDPNSRREQAARARAFVANNRGALERLLALLEPHLQSDTR